jgi:hypothetical protein
MTTMSKQFEYGDVEQYLRTFSTEKLPYDFSGLLHLVLSGIENLRKNAVDGDILEYAHFITDEQAGFLQRLLEGRAESIALFVSEISHLSQVLHGLSTSFSTQAK